MKTNKLTAAAIVLALAASLATSAKAVNAPAPATGDLILGFQENGANSDYEVDLGSVSQILNAAPSSTLTFNISTTDLGGAFGGTGAQGWSDNTFADNLALVQWGLIAGGNGNTSTTVGGKTLLANTIFYTEDSGTSPQSLGVNDQAAINSNFLNFYNSGYKNKKETGNGSYVAVTPSTSVGWTSYTPNTNGFGSGVSIEGANGPTNSTLDFYEYSDTSATAQAPTYLGNFTLNSSGVLTFDAAPAAVPEPSSLALSSIAMAGILVLILRRRKSLSDLQD